MSERIHLKLVEKRKQFREPKEMVPVKVDTFVEAVDEVIPSYLFNYELRLGAVHPKKIKRTVVSSAGAAMHNELMVNCASYSEQSLRAAASDLNNSPPPIQITKSLLNYIINSHKYTDCGLMAVVLSRLITFYPASLPSMSEYYQRLLEDRYALINDKQAEEEQFFWVVIEIIGKLPEESSDKMVFPPYPPGPEHPKEAAWRYRTSSQTDTYYKDLPSHEQQKRATLCLEFLCDILEQDLVHWLIESNSCVKSHCKPTRRSLLARLIWPDTRQEGRVTPRLQKILALQTKQKQGVTSIACLRLLALASELVRALERPQAKVYPFFGTLSFDLAREFGLILLQRQEEGVIDLAEYLKRLKPEWLQLLTTCQVLGDLAGFQCLPELSSASKVMECLEQIYKLERRQERIKENINQPEGDPVLVAKLMKLKSVNSLFRTGQSRLHKACHENNVEMVRALLTFPSLDVNITDPSGWTALHEAAARGSEDCVRELLNFTPRVGVQRGVNTRAKGQGNYTPLMRAAEEGHASICSLLLQHTGSVLLEDITDDNETALDLEANEAVRKILRHYKSVRVETIFSRQEMHLSTSNLVLVAAMCSTLVHSYMAVHRTWDVYHTVKRYSKQGHQASTSVPKILCEYSRYHRDFKTNLPKLRIMVMKLRKVPQLSAVIDVLHCIVSLNKD